MRLNHSVLTCCALSAIVSAGPLDNWHPRSNFGATYLNDIAYGAGVYVIARGMPGGIITSATLQDPPAFSTFDAPHSVNSVIFAAGQFVALGEGGLVLTSPNGLQWENHSFAEPINLRSVIYAENRFVAAGWSAILTSTNARSWQKATILDGGLTSLWPAEVTYGNGIFLVANSANSTVSSDDGLSWRSYYLDAGFYTVGFGNGRFVGLGIGSSGDNIYTSIDGKTWSTHGRLELQRPSAIAWGGCYVTGGNHGRAYSRDGFAWTLIPTTSTDYNIRFINGTFIATGFKAIHQSDPILMLSPRPGGAIELLGLPGATYQIETSDHLTSGSWTTHNRITFSEAQTSSTFEIQNPTTANHSFFRALMLP